MFEARAKTGSNWRWRHLGGTAALSALLLFGMAAPSSAGDNASLLLSGRVAPQTSLAVSQTATPPVAGGTTAVMQLVEQSNGGSYKVRLDGNDLSQFDVRVDGVPVGGVVTSSNGSTAHRRTSQLTVSRAHPVAGAMPPATLILTVASD